MGDKTTGSLFDPFVFYDTDKNIFRIYVSVRDKKNICYAESSDGIKWGKLIQSLDFSNLSGWENEINRCSVIKKIVNT